MRAMVLERPRTPLVMRERSAPEPASSEILIEVAACGVCRTDLHVVDGELPNPKLPLIPGHEIVGRVAALGAGVAGFLGGEGLRGAWPRPTLPPFSGFLVGARDPSPPPPPPPLSPP